MRRVISRPFVSARIHAIFRLVLRVPIRSALVLVLLFAQPARAATPIRLTVDGTKASRKIFHAQLVIPVSPGPLTLVYPKWIPGEPSPNGPIAGLAGLKFMTGGVTLSWRRDLVDMYAFHIDVPAGASEVEVSLDFLGSPVTAGFTAGASSTPNLAVVSWNQLLLYPEGHSVNELSFMARLQLPPEWKYGTALAVSRESNGKIEFEPVSLATLVDSPVLAGKYFRAIRIAPEIDPPHFIDLASDGDAAISMNPEIQSDYGHLVYEAGALFGSRHYRHYNFLVTLSDHVPFFGLEHHQSSDDRVWESSLIEEDRFKLISGLLPHEFVHSWDGKYRLPLDLLASDYQKPVRTDLLWVYEGLTVYLASVLSARSGLWTPEFYREYLALLAATMDHRSGRTWRSLQDTADAAQTFYAQRPEWVVWRRSADFYDEGLLIWLEADSLIRHESNGRRSLDDFCHLFFGGSSGMPESKPYTFDDVVAAMNQVQPYDWRTFFTSRLESTSPRAPLDGITRNGWRLVYTEQISRLQQLREKYWGYTDESFSLGLKLDMDGTVMDATPEMAAEKAGIAPGMKLLAINGRDGRPKSYALPFATQRATPNRSICSRKMTVSYKATLFSMRTGKGSLTWNAIQAKPTFLERLSSLCYPDLLAARLPTPFLERCYKIAHPHQQ
jgi:predicted metalloprotease with PDZ domain